MLQHAQAKMITLGNAESSSLI